MLKYQFRIFLHWHLPQFLLFVCCCVDTIMAVLQCHALPTAPLNKQHNALIAPSL